MKKVLDGLIYDTSRAIVIGRAGTKADESVLANPTTEFESWQATLYRTPKAVRYFLVGSGGPMSRFGQAAGRNTWDRGMDLIPMNREQAHAWARAYLAPAIVEAEFGGEEREAG